MLFGMVSVSGLVRARAEGETITVSFSGMYSSDTTLTTVDAGNVLLTFDKASGVSAPAYNYKSGEARIYTNNTLAIETKSTTSLNITKVEFTVSREDQPFTPDVGTYENHVWTGDASSILLTGPSTSGKQIRITKIVITLGDGGEQPDPFVKPTTPEDIVNAAYALGRGETLPEGPYTLTGVVQSIAYAYSSTNNNISVWMVVGDMEDKPIECYKMINGSNFGTDEGIAVLKVGDTITVTGNIKNYNGTIEFDQNCTLDALVPGQGEDPFVRPTTPEEIVDAAYDLAVGATLQEGPYTLTGKVTEIAYAYQTGATSISVWMVVGNMTDKRIECYKMKNGENFGDDEGIAEVKVGDTITVTGELTRFNASTVEFKAGCTLDALVSYQPHHYETPAEILEAAADLAVGETLEGGPYELTGTVTTIVTEYSSDYADITFMMEVLGQEIEAYQIKNGESIEAGKGVEILAHGDTVTVKGDITNYNGIIEFVKGSTLEEIEHSSARITSASVMLSDSIAVNFKVAENQIEDEDLEPVVTVTFNGETYELTGTLKNGKYEFIFANLTAAMMNDEMQVQLKLRRRNSEDPGTVTDEFTYSVAEYCYKALELHKNSKKLRTLLVDLLIYGEKAQIYKEYKTDDLVTKNLTEEQLAWATAEVPELTNKTELVDGGDGSIAIKAAGLNLTDGIIVRIKIAAADIYDVELSVDDGEYYIPSDKFIPAATEGQYYAFFRIANPTQLGTVHEFTFVNADDEAISKTLKYSAESYCASILEKCADGRITDQALQDIVTALVKYAYSVKAYVG